MNFLIRNTIEQATTINSSYEVEGFKVGSFRYLKIKNFLKYPKKFVDLLSNYPAIVGPNYISTPGARQNLSCVEIKNLLFEYKNILNRIDVTADPTRWINCTNIMWEGMECLEGSNHPHFDTSTWVANLWLSDHQGGTAFYKYQNTKLNKNDLSSDDNIFNITNKMIPWTNFKGNELWTQYHLLPTEFNTLYFYDGSFFHAPYPKLNNEHRYSLISFYHG